MKRNTQTLQRKLGGPIGHKISLDFFSIHKSMQPFYRVRLFEKSYENIELTLCIKKVCNRSTNKAVRKILRKYRTHALYLKSMQPFYR